MAFFKKLVNENLLFTKKGEHKYKLVLNLESKDDSIIITYIDDKIKKKIKVVGENLNQYKFLEKTKNFFYRKYIEIDPQSLLNEMDTGSVGVGGTADSQFSSDFYATGDARNVTGPQFPITRRPKITDQITNTSGKNKKKKENKKRGKKQKK